MTSVFGNSNEVWAQDGNNDLAGVFGNSLDATPTGANYLGSTSCHRFSIFPRAATNLGSDAPIPSQSPGRQH